MSWAVGWDENWKRDVGYGVPALCDHPGCNQRINRGFSCTCGGWPLGDEYGCGLHFCDEHLSLRSGLGVRQCERCAEGREPFEPKPDLNKWTKHKETDPSWAQWRADRDAKEAS